MYSYDNYSQPTTGLEGINEYLAPFRTPASPYDGLQQFKLNQEIQRVKNLDRQNMLGGIHDRAQANFENLHAQNQQIAGNIPQGLLSRINPPFFARLGIGTQ